MKHLLFLLLFFPFLAFAQADKDKPTHYLTFSSGLNFGHRQVVTRFPNMAHEYRIGSFRTALAFGWEYKPSLKRSYCFSMQRSVTAFAAEKYKVVSAKIPAYLDGYSGENHITTHSASVLLKQKVGFIHVLGGVGIDSHYRPGFRSGAVINGIDSFSRGSWWSKDKQFLYSETGFKEGAVINPFLLIGLNKDIKSGRNGRFSFSLIYQQGLLITRRRQYNYIDFSTDGVRYSSKMNFRGSNTRFMLTYSHQIGKNRVKRGPLREPENPKKLRNKLFFELGIGTNYALKQVVGHLDDPYIMRKGFKPYSQWHIGLSYQQTPTSPWVYQLLYGRVTPRMYMSLVWKTREGNKEASGLSQSISYNYTAFVVKRRLRKTWWLEGGLALATHEKYSDDELLGYKPQFVVPALKSDGDMVYSLRHEHFRYSNPQILLGISKVIRFVNRNELFFNLTYQQGLLKAREIGYRFYYTDYPDSQFEETHIFRGTVLRASVGYRMNLAKKR